MASKSEKKILESDLLEVAKTFIPEATIRLESRAELDRFFSARENFLGKVHSMGTVPFNPKFNSVLWGYDLINLSFEIIHSYIWMHSWAEYFKSKFPEGGQPSNSFGQLSFYGSSCITLIDSIRDKVALMVWAFYCPFNPDIKSEVLDYERILDRIEHPEKYGLTLEGHKDFFDHLIKLQGRDFKEVEIYRHRKVHRREPRIELYEPPPEIDNCLPITSPSMMRKWDHKLRTQYPDRELRSRIKEQCKINGVCFGSFKPKSLVWNYQTIEAHIFNCLLLIFDASAGCLELLETKIPFE